MEGEDFHCYQDPEEDHVEEHQPSDGGEDPEEEPEEEIPFVHSEAEKDAIALRALRNSGVPLAAKGVKRPRSPVLNVDDDVPDLAEIFDNYDTPRPTRISICRSYASYLSSMQPKKPRAKKPSKK